MLKTAFGPEITAALTDASVIEVIVNPDGKLWLESQMAGRQFTGYILTVEARERIIRLVASHVEQGTDKNSPIISAELPLVLLGGGERFEGLLPPIVTAPAFVIRKPNAQILTLPDYVTAQVMQPWQHEILMKAIEAHHNILVVGGTGSGKTTLANALLQEVAKGHERIILIEDTRELRCAAGDLVRLKTRPHIASLSDLVRSTLRLRPDRIIIGEVRGGEALDMLKAWNTGHPGGIATLHANSAHGALLRLEQLIQEVVHEVPQRLIADAIDLIIFIEGRGSSRHLKTLAQVTGFTDGDYCLNHLTPQP
ncbi:P-type conjugative transfer ATPase TrbB [Paremcibacter congregatus]|uniref:P-type conjugative transfer ATPase TrbB n=2 Tax=Paremcibacter congregatus TaxID=2043170 RepID=A0A2G4YNZ1_9PROT|nr:P-type conjugative transfer ATPase TrbB [Paremcibacter congregatus]PHZ85465.1 P-type conjugative transfer ATPase TrbB [Paremcibacter congregatus]QDE29131.1 P-type conjugative transfer ATPase TrbB [Paremcibacter congregatus]QDE29276.1 P-type conjugative transfer ATPase TrbB [Paremcibacter congregatus]